MLFIVSHTHTYSTRTWHCAVPINYQHTQHIWNFSYLRKTTCQAKISCSKMLTKYFYLLLLHRNSLMVLSLQFWLPLLLFSVLVKKQSCLFFFLVESVLTNLNHYFIICWVNHFDNCSWRSAVMNGINCCIIRSETLQREHLCISITVISSSLLLWLLY